MKEDKSIYSLIEPQISSKWRCYMFGGDNMGLVYTPRIDQVPNWFWRKMQYLCFGNKWVKSI